MHLQMLVGKLNHHSPQLHSHQLGLFHTGPTARELL